jgi:hypothetical protein
MPLIIPAIRKALGAARGIRCFKKHQYYELLLLIRPKTALARDG